MDDRGKAGARLSAEDLWLAGALTVVLAAIITVAGTPFSATPYVFALGFGAVLLLRRRLPRTVVVLSVLGTFAYYTLGLPTIGVALPVVAALFSAAEFGRFRTAIVAGVVVFAVAFAFRLRDDPQPLGTLVGTDAAANLGLLAAAVALGYGVQARRVYAAQQRRIARLQDESARARAAQSVQAERSRISRELHDTVGHALSVVSLHAGVAAEAVGRDDAAAAAAVAEVRRISSESLGELRAMVRLLRADDAAATQPGAETSTGGAGALATLANLESLLSTARAAGLEVNARIDLGGALPGPVGAAAYRVVQEAVTNILRHAVGARRVDVTVAEEGGGPDSERRVRVRVADDGPGTPDDATSQGTGLIGLGERVRLLGGTLSAGPIAPGRGGGSTGGFAVAATIPAGRTP